MRTEVFNTMSAYNNLFLDNPHGIFKDKDEIKKNRRPIRPL